MFVEVLSVVVVAVSVVASGWSEEDGGGFLLRSSNILERFCSFCDWILVSSRGVNELKNFWKALGSCLSCPLIERTGLAWRITKINI